MTQGTAGPFRWRLLGAGFAAAIVVAVGVCEALGWPFLVQPGERWLGQLLQRRVSVNAAPASADVANVAPAVRPKVSIHLLGHIEIVAPEIEIGAPPWSAAPRMLLARDARLTLGYADLWRASRGEPLRIRALRAGQLDAQIERLVDGRASWQFGKRTNTPDITEPSAHVPVFRQLQVDAGSVVYRDAVMELDMDAKFSLVDGSGTADTGVLPSAPGSGLHFSARGVYRKLPLAIEAHAAGVLPIVAGEARTLAVPLTLNARVGRAALVFEGTVTDGLRLSALKGRFSLRGPSLAAVGDPLRMTLPTTGPFQTEGVIVKAGPVWNVVLDRIGIGASRLAGAFTFDTQPRTPLLAGRLTGSKLLLADLGPAVGAPVPHMTASAVPAAPMPAASAPGRANADSPRMLPDREFDLPSLRAMDANVLVDIDKLDLGSRLLEPLTPLRTHVALAGGVLMLRDLDARAGQGHLGGTMQLDGRVAQAQWTADLRWDGVRLERWIHQARANNAPPYVTGALNGQAQVAGQGKSTAAILGSLRGEVRMQLVNGTVSHLIVEAAGLDIAQGLGMLIKGDDALPVRCAVADLVVEQGVLRPKVLVLDTADSTLWIDGSLSLATEGIDLRLVVTPKDFSPLALRTPLHLRGSLSNPSVGVDKGKLATRIGASALLAFVNPLAALIPLLDVGNSADAQHGSEDCVALSARIRAAPVLAPPAPLKPGGALRRPAKAAAAQPAIGSVG